jgi:hypothetical protein
MKQCDQCKGTGVQWTYVLGCLEPCGHCDSFGVVPEPPVSVPAQGVKSE